MIKFWGVKKICRYLSKRCRVAFMLKHKKDVTTEEYGNCLAISGNGNQPMVILRKHFGFDVSKPIFLAFFSSMEKDKNTPLKQGANSISNCGRSMVEMLGVLAVIGVLSVGAIAGYQKAMYKYKLNKQTQQISDFIGNSISSAAQFTPPPGEPGKAKVTHLMPYYIKMGIVPEEMIDAKQGTNNIFDVFGNSINTQYINWTHISYIETSIYFRKTDFQQCMNILVSLKELHNYLYLLFLHQLNTGDTQTQLTGDPYCKSVDYPSTPCLKDLSLGGMEHFCRACIDQFCRVAIQYNNKW